MEKDKILVIEDNQEVRENILEILELSNYEIVEAAHGKEGVEQAFATLPDLILCDVMMPELDGFGVLRILGRDIRTRDIPFIFLTAKTEKLDFRKGMGLGADDYITKPFDDTDLLAAIEMRLSKRKRLEAKTSPQQLTSPARFQQDLDAWLENREERHFQSKAIVFEEGQIANYLYYVQHGVVKSFMLNELGKELITGLYNPGQFMGYLPILQDQVYNDNAMALEEATVKLIPKKDFLEFLHRTQGASDHFLKKLAQNVTRMEQLLLDIAYSSVRKRLANALLDLSEQFQSDEFSISRENLANVIGTAKETLIRTLSDFKDERLISIEQHKIQILNKGKLQNMPN